MANTKRTNQPLSDVQAVAPEAPIVAAPIAPQTPSVLGGSPTTVASPAVAPNQSTATAAPAYTSRVSPSQAASSIQQAWNMTGTPNAYNRTFQRTVLGNDPGVAAQSLQSYWNGAASGSTQTPLPTPSTMTLPQAQQYLGSLTAQIKQVFDQQLAQMSPEQIQQSRFFQTYQAMPEPMATLAARRWWTNAMVGTGPVADWLTWVKG